MFISEKQRRCVEEIAQKRDLTCPDDCKDSPLSAKDGEWLLGGALEVYLECSNCEAEETLLLTQKEAGECGFDPEADLPDIDETL